MDVSDYNYHLSSNNPDVVDVGASLNVEGIDKDLDNNPRIQGNQIDIGPYEYQNTPLPTSPPCSLIQILLNWLTSVCDINEDGKTNSIDLINAVFY